MRAISTVLDVALFLLLVSAAVGTVAYAPTSASPESSTDATASLLATTTATVEYDVGGASREAHGTLGTLLSRVAVTNATLDETELAPRTDGFERAVGREVRRTLAAPNHTAVTATWRPYPGSPLSGRVTVGTRPPKTADVSVSTLTVPTPVDAVDGRKLDDDADSEGLSRAVASAVTDVLLPETVLDASFGRGGPTAITAASRYDAFGDALDVSLGGSLSAGNVTRANARVTDALARRLGADLPESFDSLADARAAVRTGVVTITVRRWEP